LRYDLGATAGTTAALEATLVGLAADGRPLDSVPTALESLDHVDLDTVSSLARSGIADWDSLLVVLVGDAQSLLSQLEEAGFPTPEMVEVGNATASPR
jgi:hypothetical protein